MPENKKLQRVEDIGSLELIADNGVEKKVAAESQSLPPQVAADSNQVAADSNQVAADSNQVAADSNQVAANSNQVAANSNQVAANSNQVVANSNQVVADSNSVTSHNKKKPNTNPKDNDALNLASQPIIQANNVEQTVDAAEDTDKDKDDEEAANTAKIKIPSAKQAMRSIFNLEKPLCEFFNKKSSEPNSQYFFDAKDKMLYYNDEPVLSIKSANEIQIHNPQKKFPPNGLSPFAIAAHALLGGLQKEGYPKNIDIYCGHPKDRKRCAEELIKLGFKGRIRLFDDSSNGYTTFAAPENDKKEPQELEVKAASLKN